MCADSDYPGVAGLSRSQWRMCDSGAVRALRVHGMLYRLLHQEARMRQAVSVGRTALIVMALTIAMVPPDPGSTVQLAATTHTFDKAGVRVAVANRIEDTRPDGADQLQPVAAASAPEREIRDLLTQSVRAALSLESTSAEDQIADFERNYAKDYISVASNGTVYTLRDILTEIKEKGPNRQKFTSVEMTDTLVRIHGETAVATYVMRYSLQTAGGSANRSVRESAVFVKRNGRWRRVLEQRNTLTMPDQ